MILAEDEITAVPASDDVTGWNASPGVYSFLYKWEGDPNRPSPSSKQQPPRQQALRPADCVILKCLHIADADLLMVDATILPITTTRGEATTSAVGESAPSAISAEAVVAHSEVRYGLPA